MLYETDIDDSGGGSFLVDDEVLISLRSGIRFSIPACILLVTLSIGGGLKDSFFTKETHSNSRLCESSAKSSSHM